MFKHLSQVSFENGWVLALIPLVCLLAGLWWYFLLRRYYPALRISTIAPLKGWDHSFKAVIKWILPAFRLVTLALLLVALARPQTSYDEEKQTTEGIDIVIAVDVSTSMLSKDFEPNRLEAAKREAAAFIDGRQHDRIGLVVFSGESFTQCPVTIDHNIVRTQLKGIKNGLLEDGTAIGMGLATSVQRLKELDTKSRVVILMTDGVNNRGLIDPMTASDISVQYGVRVYTIGVGTNGDALTPVAMTANGQLIFDRAPVQIDEPLLKEIAKKTGGQYFRANDDRKLKEVYQQIDKLEKTKTEVSAYERKTEKFYAFALAAAVLLLIELLLRYLVARSIP